MTAVELFNMIGRGKENALKRNRNDPQDRMLRRLIENAQNEGDIIINLGQGYYRPILSRPSELLEYRRYIEQKESRLRKFARSITRMQTTAENELMGQISFEPLPEDVHDLF